MNRSYPQHRTCRRRAPLPLILLLAASASCGGEEASGEPVEPVEAAEPVDLTSEEFVEVMVELRETERALADEDSAQQRFTERKAEILERYRTNEEELQAFVRASSRDLQGVAEIWEEISARLRRPSVSDSVSPDSTPVP